MCLFVCLSPFFSYIYILYFRLSPLAHSICDWTTTPPSHTPRIHETPDHVVDELLYKGPLERISLKLPIGSLDPEVASVFPPLEYELCPTYVARLKDACVAGMPVAVINRHGTILGDVSIDWRFPRIKHKFLYPSLRFGRRQLAGRTLMLAATGAETFSHFLFDSISRGFLLEECGLHFRDFNHIIINNLESPFQRELLIKLGIRPSQLICLATSKTIRCDELILPSYPSGLGQYHPGALNWLRKTFLSSASNSRLAERIFISRGMAKSRRIVNESQIEEILARHGFRKVFLERLPILEQFSLFSTASHIIAPHGAGLSNLAFSSKGTKVLELFATGSLNACYWTLSNYRDLNYSCLVSPKAPQKGSHGNIVVDPNSFQKFLSSWI